MTLDDLNLLQRERQALLSAESRATRIADSLQKHRNSEYALTAILQRMDRLNEEGARDAVHQVLNEMKADILRLAELRLHALAREHKIAAHRKLVILEAAILPTPEVANGS